MVAVLFVSPELTRRQEVVGPLLNVGDGDVEPGHDDAALVEATSQVDDDLAAAVVVDDLELADVAVLHHHGQEAGDDLRRGAEENLKQNSERLKQMAFKFQYPSNQGFHYKSPTVKLNSWQDLSL